MFILVFNEVDKALTERGCKSMDIFLTAYLTVSLPHCTQYTYFWVNTHQTVMQIQGWNGPCPKTGWSDTMGDMYLGQFNWLQNLPGTLGWSYGRAHPTEYGLEQCYHYTGAHNTCACTCTRVHEHTHPYAIPALVFVFWCLIGKKKPWFDSLLGK